MDYPKSVPGVGLVDGRFVNEDPATGQLGSIIPAEWGNALMSEIFSVLSAANITPSESDVTQLLQALRKVSLPIVESVPTENISPIVYALDKQDLLQWMTIGGWTGYASPRCGEIEFGWTPGVLPWQIAAEGGVYSKAAYPALYARFQASGLLVPAASWVAGEYKACDVSGTQFRVPDLRNQFLRMTGTDADTANARVMGGRQADAYRTHSHRLKGGTYQLTIGNTHASATWGSSAPMFGDTSPEGGSETRPVNTSLAPRLHV